jgi:transcriptional regulator with XRE-family HTH domain
MTFGELFKKRRIMLKKTLRQFCRENGLDSGNTSKIERSVIGPPQNKELLERYATMLEIKRGSEEWFVFFDMAAIENRRIPEYLTSNDIKKLPVLFKVFRPKDQLDSLIKIMEER